MMTVAELIRELEAMPNKSIPVRVTVPVDDIGCVRVDTEVDDVRYEGAYALIRGR